MSISKFQQLIEIITEDYAKTYQYLKKNFTFINQLTQKLADSLECDLNHLFFINSEGKIFLVENGTEGLITIRKDLFFEFQLLIKIPVQPFNTNTSDHSFIEKDLTPPSGVVLVIAIQQSKYDNNSFIVEVSSDSKKEKFTIKPCVDNCWISLLESCFELIKAMLEGGVERRIDRLETPKNNNYNTTLGYIWREKE
jgi:hypothetical protein